MERNLSCLSKGEDHWLALVAGREDEGTFGVGLSRRGTPTELVRHKGGTGRVWNRCSVGYRNHIRTKRRAQRGADSRRDDLRAKRWPERRAECGSGYSRRNRVRLLVTIAVEK